MNFVSRNVSGGTPYLENQVAYPWSRYKLLWGHLSHIFPHSFV
jgi:hypothetical protein